MDAYIDIYQGTDTRVIIIRSCLSFSYESSWI